MGGGTDSRNYHVPYRSSERKAAYRRLCQNVQKRLCINVVSFSILLDEYTGGFVFRLRGYKATYMPRINIS
jgi:hypothetical protein